MFDSVSITALTSALDGLAERQRAIAGNIANVNTPGYTARRVLFEDALARSVEVGSDAVAPTVARSLEPTRLDGNNVNLETETLSNIDTMLRYQFAAQSINGSLTSVRAAMRTA